jgi:AbrB family looped-hinge helix DNA binding protein
MRDLSATFTSKGQLVIPAELRRKHGIEAGTKVKFLEDDFGRIVIQPITEEYIDRVRGMLAGGPDLLATLREERRRGSKFDSENLRTRHQRAARSSGR